MKATQQFRRYKCRELCDLGGFEGKPTSKGGTTYAGTLKPFCNLLEKNGINIIRGKNGQRSHAYLDEEGERKVEKLGKEYREKTDSMKKTGKTPDGAALGTEVRLMAISEEQFGRLLVALDGIKTMMGSLVEAWKSEGRAE